MTLPEVVVVEWDDAHGSTVDEVNESSLASMHAAAVMRTIGWLVLLDDEGASIANELQPDGTYRGHSFVPLGIIRAIRVLTKQPLHRRPAIYERED